MKFRLFFTGVLEDIVAVTFPTTGVDTRIEVAFVSFLKEDKCGITSTRWDCFNGVADKVSWPGEESCADTSCGPSEPFPVSRSCCCCRTVGDCPGVETFSSSSGDKGSAKGSDMLTKVTRLLSQLHAL